MLVSGALLLSVFAMQGPEIESGIAENDNCDHFDMRDYHVFSMESIEGAVTDHGVALDLKDISWGGRQ